MTLRSADIVMLTLWIEKLQPVLDMSFLVSESMFQFTVATHEFTIVPLGVSSVKIVSGADHVGTHDASQVGFSGRATMSIVNYIHSKELEIEQQRKTSTRRAHRALTNASRVGKDAERVAGKPQA